MYSEWTHTWMAFVPGLPGKIDFTEILGFRVPLPTLVLNNNNDADRILGEVCKKADA